MPYMIVEEDGKYCVHKQKSDKTAGESLHCYTGDGAEAKAKKYMKALYSNTSDASEFQGGEDSMLKRVMTIREQFNEQFNVKEPQSYYYIRDIFDDYVIIEEGEELYKAGYKMDDEGEPVFDEEDKWQRVKQEYVPLSQRIGNLLTKIFSPLMKEKKPSELSGFVFSDLSSFDFSTQTFIDGMAAGTFTTMMGEEVTFEPEELEAYVTNTQKVIESTRTEKGEIVGLPIDENSHDHKGGAGWIVGLEHDKRRNIIRFLVNWTDVGVNLIKTNVRRFFSPSIDKNGEYIRGGSLTNWPATRLSTGQILLRPVELSENLKELDMDNAVLDAINGLKQTITDALTRHPSAPPEPQSSTSAPDTQDLSSGVSPALRELLGSQEGIDELGRRAMEIAQDAIKAEKRKIHVVEFASRVVGGTREKPFGLRVRPNDLVALLLSLPERQAAAVEKILEQTLDAAIDFSEHGVDSLGYIRKPKLPNEYRSLLGTWIAAGRSLQEFFTANPEVGEYDAYDLSEFQVKE